MQAKTCPQCGGSIPSDAPGGFCPRCALTCGLKCGLPETPGSPEAGALPAIRYFGDYELLEEIGRGGMGVVYRARQLTLNRTVAVKMILASRLATPAEVDLFRAEARTAGRLHHPGIVGIHEVGEHEGQHYFSMDYVEGQSLAHAVRDGPLAASRAAHYLRDIAQAVQHAHSQGILHRDLKPSNILLDAADRPRVTDFGLAKQLSGRAELTLSGQILGSPNFMPPEQAAGKRARVGPYSDVYSLGAILYQMLTGRPPFVAETLTATLHQVMNADPVAPRILNPSVPRDLETICLKCLNKEPGKRYATADALADELDRFLRSEPIVARPLSRAAKAWRWCRRKPVLAGWIAISLLLLASGTSGVLWQWRRAVTGERVAQQNLYAADMNLVQQALSENNLGRATELLARHLPVRLATASQLAVTGDDLRGWEWRYLWECCRTDELFVLGQHSGRIVGIAFSPDGRHLASADSDGKVQLWDLMSRKTLASIEYARYVSGIAFSPDGRHLACAGLGVPAIMLNVPTLTRSFAAGRSHRAMTFADGGKALYTDRSGTLQRWDVESGLLTWQSASNDVFRLPGINPQAAFSPDGAKFAVGTFERGARVWDVQSAAEMASFPREGDEFLFRLAFSPDGGTLATGHTDGTVTLWALSGGQRRLRTLGGHTSWITALAYSPDGTRLASGSYDHAIVVWDTTTGQKLTWLKGHEDEVDALAFSPDGRKLASGSKDQSIRLWDLTRPRAAESWKRFPSPSFPCVLSPDGSTALVRDLDRGFVAWNISSFTPLAPPISGSNLIVGAVSALGRHVALAPRLGSIQLYAYNDGTLAPVGELSVGTNPIAAVAYSALENVLAAFSENGRVMLWDTESKSPIKQFQHFTNMSGSLSFLGDGRWLGIRYAENLGEIFDVTNRRRVALFKGHRGSVMDIAVSHNRRLAATGGFDHTVKLWRMTGADGATELATLKGHLTPVWSVAFSRDDTRLAAGLGGGEIRIWNVEALQEVATLRGHRLPVTALHFTASDETLVSVSGDSLRVWKAPPLAEIDRQAASRSTTPETSLDDSPR